MHIDYRSNQQREMPEVERPDLVGSAIIWNCRYRSLDRLAELVNIHSLEILCFPDDSLQVLKGLSKLRHLRVVHLPKVRDLGPLATLSQLQNLALETLPGWDSSGKVTEVESLEPLGEILELRHVQLFGVRPPDRSLAALERCKKLVSARFHKFPKKEVERFRAATGASDAFVPDIQRDG